VYALVFTVCVFRRVLSARVRGIHWETAREAVVKSSLKRVLPDEVDDDLEAIILRIIRAKMMTSCRFLVGAVRALEKEFGAGKVQEVVREALHKVEPRGSGEVHAPEEDLFTYLDGLEHACAGTHEWERASERSDEVRYRFTRCMWAEVFRELEAPDIGRWLCDGDDPSVRSYNPALRCKLTKRLMDGGECCDHVFHVAGVDDGRSGSKEEGIA